MLQVLEAIGGAYSAPLTPEEQQELIQYCKELYPDLSEEQVASLAKLHYGNVQNATLEFKRLVETHLPKHKQKMIKLVLWLLGTSLGTSLLCGSKFKPFFQLSKEEKEKALKGWSNSVIPDIRVLHKVFWSLANMLSYGGYVNGLENPIWTVNQYIGPVKGNPEVWQPPFVNQALFLEHEQSYDVVVIGSGAGGGVLAAELSQNGQRVLVVDKAKYLHPKDIPFTEQQSYEALYEDMAFVATDDGGFQILMGKAWGGGTTVNWSASLQLPEISRKEWAEVHGLTHFNTPLYQQHIDAVVKRLGISTDSVKHNKANQALLDGCKALGLEGLTIPQNAQGQPHDCAHCTFGCPTGQKQSSLLTWIKDAVENGAHLLQDAQCDKIVHENSRVKGVLLSIGGKPKFVQAKRVVVACGSINSPVLLLKSKIKNPNIGKNLKLHPVMTVMGVFKEDKLPGEGTIMTALYNGDSNLDKKGYGARLEVPAAHPASYLLMQPYLSPLELKKRALEYRRSVPLIVLTRDKDGAGTVSLNAENKPLIHYKMGKEDVQHMCHTAITAAKILLAAGATKVRTAQNGGLEFVRTKESLEETLESKEFKDFCDEIKKRSVVLTKTIVFCAHQMGSNRMGIDPKKSVVKPTGESWDVQGLYIADGSVLPTASGVNPMLTIYSVCYGIAQHLKQDFNSAKL